jgi:hypothetical protein
VGEPELARTVADLMSRCTITIDADATLAEARERMVQHAVYHLLVTDRERIVAVLSNRDLLRQTSPYVGTPSESESDAATLRRRIFHAASYDLDHGERGRADRGCGVAATRPCRLLPAGARRGRRDRGRGDLA